MSPSALQVIEALAMQAAADRAEAQQKLHKKSQKPQKSMREISEEGLAAPIAKDNKYGAQAATCSHIAAFHISHCETEGPLQCAALIILVSHMRADAMSGDSRCWLPWGINMAKD